MTVRTIALSAPLWALLVVGCQKSAAVAVDAHNDPQRLSLDAAGDGDRAGDGDDDNHADTPVAADRSAETTVELGPPETPSEAVPDAPAPDAATDDRPAETALDAPATDGPTDAAPDSAPDLPRDAPPEEAMPPPACGARGSGLDVGRAAHSMLIAADGTVYVATPGGDVNIVPAGKLTARPWVRISPAAGELQGLALDVPRRRLYVASPNARRIYALDMRYAPPALSVLLKDILPFAMTIGPDGNLYFSDAADQHIYRVLPTGDRTRITQAPLVAGKGAGITAMAFNARGDLMVATMPTSIFRITLGGSGLEASRSLFQSINGPEYPKGLAFDSKDRLYVSTYPSSHLLRFESSTDPGALVAMASVGSHGWGPLAFGVGYFACTNLFVAGEGDIFVAHDDVEGLRMPWQMEALPPPVPPDPPPAIIGDGGVTTGRSGLQLSRTMSSLSGDELNQFCDWYIPLVGGYQHVWDCPTFVFQTPINRDFCALDFKTTTGCVATVAQAEECITRESPDPCSFDWLDSPACLSLFTCQR